MLTLRINSLQPSYTHLQASTVHLEAHTPAAAAASVNPETSAESATASSNDSGDVALTADGTADVAVPGGESPLAATLELHSTEPIAVSVSNSGTASVAASGTVSSSDHYQTAQVCSIHYTVLLAHSCIVVNQYSYCYCCSDATVAVVTCRTSA